MFLLISWVFFVSLFLFQLFRFLQIPYLILQLNTFIFKHSPPFIICVHMRWTMWYVPVRIQNGGPSSKNTNHPTTKSGLFSLWIVSRSGDLNQTFLWVRTNQIQLTSQSMMVKASFIILRFKNALYTFSVGNFLKIAPVLAWTYYF